MKYLLKFHLVAIITLSASFLLGQDNDSTSFNSLKRNQRDFITTHHHLSFGSSWIAFQPLQFTSMQGPVKVRSGIGHSYKFDLGYSYWHNNHLGLYVGVGIGKICYRIIYRLDKNKYSFPYNDDDFVFAESFRDLFFYIPILGRLNMPIKQKASVFLETGINLVHHPRSYIDGYVSYDVNRSSTYTNMYIITYRNANGNSIYAYIPIGLGTMIKLPYLDFISLKLHANILTHDIINGQMDIFNVGKGNDSRVTYKMNASYFGVEVAYVFTGGRAYMKRQKKKDVE